MGALNYEVLAQTHKRKNLTVFHGSMNDLFPGATQATLVILVGYPFDITKSRMQKGMYPSTISAFKGTFKNEGLSGFYRGAAAPMVSHLMNRPIQYYIAENYKKKLNESINNDNPLHNYFIGGATGALGPIFGTPLQVVKVGMQTSTSIYAPSHENSIVPATTTTRPNTSYQCAKSIYLHEGIRGFYRGFLPTMMKDTLFGASFLGHYYTMRDLWGADTWYKNFISGASAHCITWFTLIPIDTIKTQYQSLGNTSTIPQIITNIYKTEGLARFWRGVVPACIRTIPVSGIAMVGYELARQSTNTD